MAAWDNPEPLDEGLESLVVPAWLPDTCDTTVEPPSFSRLSMPNPIEVLEPRALSSDFLELTDFVDFVGLDGTGVLSSEGADVRVALSVCAEAGDCLGDMRIESPGLEGSIVLLRCQKRAGEAGLLFLEVGASSRGREEILVSLDEAWLELLLELCFSRPSPSRRPRGFADVW